MSLAALGAGLPGWRRLATLVAGRAGFRVAQWLSGVGLVVAWGPALFAPYATALASSAWLHVLVSAGTEKALLSLGPRPGGERLPRLLVTASLVPHATGLVALGLALSGLPVLGQDAVLWAAAGAYSTGVGLVIVLIAVLRLGGRPGWDPAGVGVVAGAHLVAVPAAHLTEAPPPAVLAGVALASTAAAALLLSQVVRDPAWRPAGDVPRPRAGFVLSTVAYLGATEIGSLVATALVYRELAVSPYRGDASWLYLALVMSGALVALVVYLTRLAAPHLAREVETEGPSAALAQGRSVFGRPVVRRQSGGGHHEQQCDCGGLARIVGRARLAAEPDAARLIVQRCGRLPLALRAAGARLAAKPHWRLGRLADLLAAEHRRLDELAAGDLDVRGSIARSYIALGPHRRRALRLLGGLPPASFPAALAAEVFDTTPGEADRLLEGLVDDQLLQVAGEDADGAQRYCLAELVRVYAVSAEAEAPLGVCLPGCCSARSSPTVSVSGGTRTTARDRSNSSSSSCSCSCS